MSTLSKNRKVAALGIIVIIVLAGMFAYYITRPTSLSFSVASSTSVGTAGSSIIFTVIPSLSSASINSVVWNFGDGVNQTASGATVSHTYADGGRYLIMAQVTATYQSFLFPASTVGSNALALFPLTVESSLTQNQAQEASVPTISFSRSANPTAPVFESGTVIEPVGGFLESPANSNWTISEYLWDFGNGNKQSVAASNETSDPAQNVTVTYSTPGLYAISLTLTTSWNGATFQTTTVRTIAVQSSTAPFMLLTTPSGLQNPGVITSVENWPGGPYSFDPQINYNVIGGEEQINIYQTLVFYDGASTSSFIPYLAASLPTRDNGGISPDYTTYTFQIRTDQYFSNGDPVTAYDVWFTMMREIAFAGGAPGTPGWIQAQFLIPGVQNGTASVYANNTWTAAANSITCDNASNTLTFHFNRPMPSTLAFQTLALWGAGIVDSRYASSVGAGFNQANWDSYKNQGNAGNYNSEMQWSPVGSGPFMIQTYTPGQSVVLAPNPHYGGVPGIPKVNDTVVIDWVKTPDTAVLMFQEGQADSAYNLPSLDYPAMQNLQSQGRANIYNYPSQNPQFYGFNINIDKALETSQFGPGFNEQSNYFADLPTRMAWIDAFDYKGYIDNIIGNAKYNATFATGYQGLIPPGMPYYVAPDQLGGLPEQNIAAAEGNYSISAWANQPITIPIVVQVGNGVPAAQEWAGALAKISNGNIKAQIVQVTWGTWLGLFAQNANPMGVTLYGWGSDYPDPSDTVGALYLQGGYAPSGNNWLVANFASLAPSSPQDVVHLNGTTYTQAQVYKWLVGNGTLGGLSVDPAVRASAYLMTLKLAIALGLYVYLYNPQTILFFRSWLQGYASQENPVIGGAGMGLCYFWLTKE